MAYLADSKEVAEHFGVTETTVRTWVREGRVPESAYVRLPRRYRFDIQAMVEHFRIATQKDGNVTHDKPRNDSEFELTDEDL